MIIFSLCNKGVNDICPAQITVTNNPSLPQSEVEISNTFLIDPQADDLELALRLSTGIKNGDVFYTDLNGMQVRSLHFLYNEESKSINALRLFVKCTNGFLRKLLLYFCNSATIAHSAHK